ncbi:hypothetical protein TNCV_4457251 [Trichonephila clavipes]|nr:hypothetical protein TNCV_4457251 [Trichonephila clavipes]
MINKQQVDLLLDHNHNKVESRPIALVGGRKSLNLQVTTVVEWIRLRFRDWRIVSSSPRANEELMCRGADAYSKLSHYRGLEVLRVRYRLRSRPCYMTEVQIFEVRRQ